jgi:hypothetical protein
MERLTVVFFLGLTSEPQPQVNERYGNLLSGYVSGPGRQPNSSAQLPASRLIAGGDG